MDATPVCSTGWRCATVSRLHRKCGRTVFSAARHPRKLMAMEGPDGRFLSASTFAAKIASAGNFNGSKNSSGCARSKILDALIPATPEASPVSSTQHIHLSLNNPSLHLSKHAGRFLRARFLMPAAPRWIPAPVPGCDRRGAFRPKFETPSEPPTPIRSSGGNVSQRVLPVVGRPQLRYSPEHVFSKPNRDVT